MLFCEPTPNGVGLTIWGCMHDMDALAEAINNLIENASYIESATKDFLEDNLWASVRRAARGDELAKQIGGQLLVGFKSYWIVFLVQVVTLRDLAKITPTGRIEQAHLFLLEHIAEKGLMDLNPTEGKRCLEWMFSNSDASIPVKEAHIEYLWYVTGNYMTKKKGKTRIKELYDCLMNLAYWTDEYTQFEQTVDDSGVVVARKMPNVIW